MRILKATLEVVPRQMIHAPVDTVFHSVGEQNGQLVLWYSGTLERPSVPYIIRVQTTGDEIGESIFDPGFDPGPNTHSRIYGKKFIGTAILGKDGPWFVAHVFLQYGDKDKVDERHKDDFRQIQQELRDEYNSRAA